MARDQAPSRASDPDWLVHDYLDRIDDPAVRDLLRQLAPSHPEVVPELFRALIQLSTCVTWFDAAVEERTDLDAFKNAVILQSATQGRSNPRAKTEDHWQEKTLLLANKLDETPEGLAEFLALFVVALIDRSLNADFAVPPSAVEQFAQQIRGVARRASAHPDRAALFKLKSTDSWRNCVLCTAAAFRSLGDKASEQAKFWASRWPKWAEQISAKAPKAVVPPPPTNEAKLKPKRKPRPASGKRSRTRRLIEDTRLGVRTPVRRQIFLPPPVDQAPDCAEPVLESVSPEIVLSPDVPIEETATYTALAKEISKRTCFQSLKLRNSELSTSHIDVLNDAEIAVLVPELRRRLDSALANDESAHAAIWASYLLVIALGCDPERVEQIPVGSSSAPACTGQRRINLATGTILCPVLRPAGAAEPKAHAMEDVEPTVDEFELPLPPTLIDRLRNLARMISKPEFTLVDLIRLIDYRQTMRNLADEVQLSPISLSMSRARRVLATRVYAQSHDMADTMLICGDTLGRSDAPLYYYAPLRKSLAATYQQAVWPLFGDSPIPEQSPTVGKRVGSKVVAREKVVIQGFRTLDRLISDAHTDLKQGGIRKLARYHNLYTVSVACRFALITTERPTDRKFALRRDQIDTGHRLVVLDDKRVDAEHALRLAALSPELTDQFEYYFQHLAAISSRADVPEVLRCAAGDAVESRGPLFNLIDQETLLPKSISLEEWVSLWPPQWSCLPRNWYRHYFVTRMRELEAPPLLVLAQCGHLESARHPFTQSSGLSGIKLSRMLEAPLSRLEASLSIRKRKSPLISGALLNIEIPPLSSWKQDLSEQQKMLQAIERKRLKHVASEIRKDLPLTQNTALTLVYEHCASLAELISCDISEAKPDPALADQVMNSFTPRIAARLSRAIDQFKGSSEFRLAIRRQMWRRIRAVSLKHSLRLPDIGWGILGPRAEASPFLLRGPLALRQISALRTEFMSRSTELQHHQPQLNYLLTLVLMAAIYDRKEIERIMAGSKPIGIVRQGQPRLVLEVGQEEPKTIIGFSGAAAILVAHLGSKPKSTALPRVTELNSALRAQFPKWFHNCSPGSEIDVLLETREIAARFDLSGAARLMASPAGSTAANRDTQIRLLTNDACMMPASNVPANAETMLYEADEDEAPARNFTIARKEAFEFYNQHLLPALGGGAGRAVDDPRETLISQQRSLNHLTAGLERSPRIEHRLAFFARNLAVSGTNHRAKLAASTIFTYVTSIARPLIDRLAGIDLRELDADDFADLYVQILESVGKALSVTRTARQLLAFHEQLIDVFAVDPVDTSVLRPYLQSSGSNVVATAINDAEYHRVWSQLQREEATQVESDGESKPRDIRQLRLTRLLLMLLHRTGGRFREILFLRHEDIWIHDKSILLWIRSTAHRSLKSHNARRLCDLTDSLSENERRELKNWLCGEQIRLGNRYCRSRLVFDCSSREDSLIPTVTESALREQLRNAFQSSSGRRFWPHLLRHGWADRELRTWLDSLEHFSAVAPSAVHQLNLRCLATQLGHGSFETSIENYLHMPWLLRATETHEVDRDLGRLSLATLSNRTLAAIDKIQQRQLPLAKAYFMGPGDSLTDRVLIQSGLPLMPEQVLSEPVKPAPKRDPAILIPPFSHYYAMTRHKNSESIGYVLGLLPQQIDRMKANAAVNVHQVSGGSLEKAYESEVPAVRNINRFGVLSVVDTIQCAGRDARFSLAALFSRTHSKRISTRERAFAGRYVDVEELQRRLVCLGVSGLILIPPESDGSRGLWRLKFERNNDELTPFGVLESVLVAVVGHSFFSESHTP